MTTKRTSPLTRERVLRAALDIVDEEGLDALTMRRLGAELGVEAMSLYYHVPNKAAVLDGISELVLSEIELDDSVEGDWVDALRNGFRQAWAVLKSHPNAIPLLLVSPSGDQEARRLAEVVLALMQRGGLTPAEGHRAFRILQAFIFGAAMAARARPNAEAIEAQVRELADLDGGYPLLQIALKDLASFDSDGDFEVGMELLLDSLARQGPEVSG